MGVYTSFFPSMLKMNPTGTCLIVSVNYLSNINIIASVSKMSKSLRRLDNFEKFLNNLLMFTKVQNENLNSILLMNRSENAE